MDLAYEVGQKLACPYDGTAARKEDRQFTARTTALLNRLAQLGYPYSGWQLDPSPPTERHSVQLLGADDVTLRLYNHHSRMLPKDISFGLWRGDTMLLMGIYSGQFRLTDLTAMTSEYDGAVWSLAHHRAWLYIAARRGKLRYTAKEVESRMARSAAHMESLGIAAVKPVLLPVPSSSGVSYLELEPYLLGSYGAVPIAVRPRPSGSIVCLDFHTVGRDGVPQLRFGYAAVNEHNEVTGEVDIASLIQ